MRFGPIPEYEVDIAEDEEGIPMVLTFHGGRWVWVELTDPCLDGKVITRIFGGGLAAKDK